MVIWSAEATRSEWVRSEAEGARAGHKLVQLTIDGAKLPMPFDRIQCADLSGWSGDLGATGWRKVVASVADLVGGTGVPAAPVADAPLPLPSKPSIAVMPFANLSGDPEQAYFVEGMVEEIVAALTRNRQIFGPSLKAGSRPFAAHKRTVRSDTPSRTAAVCTERIRSPSAVYACI